MARSTSLPGFLMIAFMILFFLFVAPYTKVEESFNMQAIHDLLTYGVQSPTSTWLREHYDHFAFPGAVPRTFVGAVALATICKPLALFLDGGGEALQTGVRAVLGLWNAACIALFAGGVQRSFGGRAGAAYLAFQACQFHVVYYASRTLPNFLAFGFVLLALRDLLPRPLDRPGERGVVRRRQRALALMTVMGVVFRSELAVFLACHTLNEMWRRRLGIVQVVQAGLAGLVTGLILTVATDSFFWQRPVWPELNAFVFNVIEGKSEEWGVSPIYYYFLNSLPKLLFNPTLFLICIPTAISRDARVWDISIPSLAHVAILSLQGHKEWRFIIYVVPPLTAVAAVGFDRLRRSSKKSKATSALKLAVIFSHLLCLAATFIFLIISSLNYPGAAALNRFHIASRTNNPVGVVAVYMDTLTCMTGVTRFLEIPATGPMRKVSAEEKVGFSWEYSKEENETALLDIDFWSRFDYAITESPDRAVGIWDVWDPHGDAANSEPNVDNRDILGDLGFVTGYSGFVITKDLADLKWQQLYAGLSGGDPSKSFSLSNLGRLLLMLWNDLGLSVSPLTKGRWLTIRMNTKLYLMKRKSVNELA